MTTIEPQGKQQTMFKFDINGKCPECESDKGFESVHLELDEEFGYQITCNNCNAKFHEIYQFSFWEKVQ